MWTIRHYNRGGSPISTNYAGYSDVGTTNEIAHATDRRMGFFLNNYDTLEFSVYLDDPVATQIEKATSFIKVWRNVPGYSDPSNQPCFAGYTYYTRKSGAENIMNVKCASPFWKLLSRFHIDNHYLKVNVDTGEDYRQSELIWKLIKLLETPPPLGAFGDGGYMGIDKGTFFDRDDEVVIAPFWQPRGQWSYTEIFEEILDKAGSVDLIPRYHHTDGSRRLMFLDTALKRGTDRSGSVAFNYHTGSNDNCDNLVEEEFITPGKFANYVWAVGAGGPNSGKVAIEADPGSSGLGYNAISVYMAQKDYPDIKRMGIRGANPPKTATQLRAHALNDFARAMLPDLNYEVTLSPAAPFYYGAHFSLGDVVSVNASKGALQLSGLKQRIYEVNLSISDNNMETIQPLISDDFTGKVAG